MVNLRLSALGRFENRLPLASSYRQEDGGERGKRPIIFSSGEQPVMSSIFLRAGLKSGDRLVGPAVIEEAGATILLYPGDKAEVNEFGHLIIDIVT
jgi:N-methylhydantoinase A/oxoprolinase/acetone carboxylase beta subunit